MASSAAFFAQLEARIEARAEARFGPLERRVKRIEEKLNDIISRLTVPGPEEVAGQAPDPIVHAAKSGPYLYQHLDASRSEIRILVLYSSLQEQDPIICELLHAGLDGNPSGEQASRSLLALETFNTLSYTWGDLNTEGRARIEGHEFPVTANLEAALRHMRNLKGPAKSANTPTKSFWWIDAICINQDDVLERNQQVNLMTRIYKQAAGVHIWLGDEADHSGLALDVIRRLGDDSPRGPGEADIVYPDITADQRQVHWNALTALCDRPWWERVWVRQEVAIAKEAMVHCGSQTCTFAAMTMTLDILIKMEEQLGHKPTQQEADEVSKTPITNGLVKISNYFRAYELACFREGMGSRPALGFKDLKDLILHTRACKATDARDKVFSVLGLVDPDFWDLKADYRLSLTETFIAAARCVISKAQSLDLLSGCQNPERSNGLPSWVPNLTDGWKARPFSTQRHFQEVAAGEGPDFTFEGEGNKILRAKGLYIDNIATITGDTPKQDATAEELDALSANWKRFAATAISYPEIDAVDKRYAQQYQQDGPWVQFLSANADLGQPRAHAATPLDTQGNYLMAKTLLLPENEDGTAVKDKGMKARVHEHLRRLGVGRKVCITHNGGIVLVPADSKVGDEMWLFRGTTFAYILRQVNNGEYVVVGEGYSFRTFHPYTLYGTLAMKSVSII